VTVLEFAINDGINNHEKFERKVSKIKNTATDSDRYIESWF